jgi:hypothetical protein
MLNKNKALFVAFVALVASLSLTSCYTQLARYDDTERQREEEYVDNQSNSGEEATPDTIVVHQNRTDVYMNWPSLPILYDAWWYEPYGYYGSNSWWRWHHRWDPWSGYSSFYGDPFYWPSYSYYGGWGFFGSPYYGYSSGYNGYYGYHGNGDDTYWGGSGGVGNHGRRPFDRRGMTPRSLGGQSAIVDRDGTAAAKSAVSGGRSVVSRRGDGSVSTGSQRTRTTDDWYSPDAVHRTPVPRSSTEVERNQTNRSGSTQQGHLRRDIPVSRNTGSDTGVQTREIPARKSSDPTARRSTGSSAGSSSSGSGSTPSGSGVREAPKRAAPSSGSSSSGSSSGSGSSSERKSTPRSSSSDSHSGSNSGSSSSSYGGSRSSSSGSGSSSGGSRSSGSSGSSSGSAGRRR